MNYIDDTLMVKIQHLLIMLSLVLFYLQAEGLPPRAGQLSREELLVPKHPKWVCYFAEYMFSWGGCIYSLVQQCWHQGLRDHDLILKKLSHFQRAKAPCSRGVCACRLQSGLPIILTNWQGPTKSQPHRISAPQKAYGSLFYIPN